VSFGAGADLPAVLRVYTAAPLLYLEVSTPTACTLLADLFFTYAYSHTCEKAELQSADGAYNGIHFGGETSEWFLFGPIEADAWFHIRCFCGDELRNSLTIYHGDSCGELEAFDEFATDDEWHEYQRTWFQETVWVQIIGPFTGTFDLEIRPGHAP
jgi:hypothetical protein